MLGKHLGDVPFRRDRYSAIKARELLSHGWEREKYHHLAPKLMEFIQHFNDIR